MNVYFQSKYHYMYHADGKYCVYNTLYGGIVVLDKEEYELLSQGRNTEDELSETERFFVENGLWITDDIDETERFLKFREIADEYDNDHSCAVIAVTTSCNARCFYCFEKGIRQNDMTIEAADKVIEFFRKLAEQKDTLHIVWYGGEPLMNPDMISYISEKLRDMFRYYSASMITNGILFDECIVEKAVADWNLRRVQISLDGTEKTYNKRKNYVDKSIASPFLKVIDAIQMLVDREIAVSIRLNMDDENYMDILDLLSFLRQRFKGVDNILIYPALLTGNDKSANALTEETAYHYIEKILEEFGDIVNVEQIMNTSVKITPCMLHDKNSFAIGPDGKCYLCEHYIGRDGYEGKKESFSLNDQCRECPLLPLCLGGCEANRSEGNLCCSITKYCINAYLRKFCSVL